MGAWIYTAVLLVKLTVRVAVLEERGWVRSVRVRYYPPYQTSDSFKAWTDQPVFEFGRGVER